MKKGCQNSSKVYYSLEECCGFIVSGSDASGMLDYVKDAFNLAVAVVEACNKWINSLALVLSEMTTATFLCMIILALLVLV